MNHGFQFIPIGEVDWVFGNLPKKGLTDGQWSEFLPEGEYQKKNIETNNCTGYATLNCVEILHKRIYGEEVNYSERFLGIMASTRPPGNNLQKVCETIRKYGLLPESDLPFLDTFTSLDEYYSPYPMHQDLKDKAKKIPYQVQHEWVFPMGVTIATKQKLMKEALKYSPLAASVFAWRRDDNGDYFKYSEEEDNHVCTIYGYEDGIRWYAFDSYDNTLKLLKWDYNFQQVKRFYLAKPKISFIEWIKSLFISKTS